MKLLGTRRYLLFSADPTPKSTLFDVVLPCSVSFPKLLRMLGEGGSATLLPRCDDSGSRH